MQLIRTPLYAITFRLHLLSFRLNEGAFGSSVAIVVFDGKMTAKVGQKDGWFCSFYGRILTIELNIAGHALRIC